MSRWCTLTALLLTTTVASQAFGQAPSPYISPDGVGGGVQQAGHYSREPKYPPMVAPSSGPYYGGMAPIPAGPGRMIYEELPDDHGWLYEDSPLERMLKETFRHAYFRAEYLLWDIGDPGNNFLGANSSLSFVLDPDRPNIRTPVDDVAVFPLSDSNGNPIAVVQPTLANVLTNENNGIRGTFGLPVLNAGTFEASIFALQTSNGRYVPPDIRFIDVNGDGTLDFDGLIPGGVDVNNLVDEFGQDFDGDGLTDVYSRDIVDAVAQAVLVDRQLPPGNNFLLINGLDTNRDGRIDTPAYEAQLKTQLWGTEGNFLLDPYNPNKNLTMSPLLGFRLINFREDLRQRGGYTVATTTNNVTTYADYVRKIDSDSNNYVYGPQIGARFELRSKRLSLGVTPKAMVGVNSYKNQLQTAQILSPLDPSKQITDKGTTFGIIGDLDLYTRLYLSDHFSLQVGYNFMWVGNVSRPADNIVYNVATGTTGTRSDFLIDTKYSGAIVQGITLGGQLEY